MLPGWARPWMRTIAYHFIKSKCGIDLLPFMNDEGAIANFEGYVASI